MNFKSMKSEVKEIIKEYVEIAIYKTDEMGLPLKEAFYSLEDFIEDDLYIEHDIEMTDEHLSYAKNIFDSCLDEYISNPDDQYQR